MSARVASTEPKSIKDLYASDAGVRGLIDVVAGRTSLDRETTADELLGILASDGAIMSRLELIRVLKALVPYGAGDFVHGRRSFASRFKWANKPHLIAREAAGWEGDRPPIAPARGSVRAAPGVEVIHHTYQLRKDFRTELPLPSDLSREEADKLAKFIRALSVD